MSTLAINQKYLVIPWLAGRSMSKESKKQPVKTWSKEINILRKDISNSWQGVDSVEEIRSQRIKSN